MSRVGRFVLAAMLVLWCCPAAHAADERGEDETTPRAAGPVLEPSQVLRIAAVSTPIVNLEEMMEVALEPLPSGPRVTYYVPNLPVAPNEKAFNPLPEVSGPVDTLGVGAVVQVRIAPGRWGVALVGIKAVPHLPGEDTPDGYVFVRTSMIGHDGKDHVLVHVTKFGRPSTFIVPSRPHPGGFAPDPAVAAALAHAEAGAVLEVRTQDQQIAGHPVIRYLGEYRPTLTGRFLWARSDTGGRATVRINVGEETVELAVPAAGPDAPLLRHDILSSLVTGRTVRFTTTGGMAPKLRSIELEGSIRKDDTYGYVVTCGGRSFDLEPARGPGPNRLELSPSWRRGAVSPGVVMVTDRTLRRSLLLDPEQLKRLEEMQPPAIPIDQAAVGQIVGLVLSAADSEQRFEAEQKLYGLVQEYAVRVEQAWDEQDQAVRKVLTPDQYEVLSQVSGPRGGMFVVGR